MRCTSGSGTPTAGTCCAGAASGTNISKVNKVRMRVSEEQRQAKGDGDDAGEIRVRVAARGLRQVVARLVRGGKEVRAHLGAQAPVLPEVEAETAADLADALDRVARLVAIGVAHVGAGVLAEVDRLAVHRSDAGTRQQE